MCIRQFKRYEYYHFRGKITSCLTKPCIILLCSNSLNKFCNIKHLYSLLLSYCGTFIYNYTVNVVICFYCLAVKISSLFVKLHLYIIGSKHEHDRLCINIYWLIKVRLQLSLNYIRKTWLIAIIALKSVLRIINKRAKWP